MSMEYASIEKLKESLLKVSHFNNGVCTANIISYADEQKLHEESVRLRNEEDYKEYRRLLGFSAEEAPYQSHEDESSTEDEDTGCFNKQRKRDIEIRNYMIEAGVATKEPFDAKQYF
ncbi:uncharacterized protein LOC111045157 isoform X3 [Nilaparvata lugens]|uniref:uncharacterized protein LOC111045157 isoform X3 n=1 Tax=Nilaparvata lugens TaxID=108931 RepID=UPI00193D5943|nr:uncharacterized protein LOC111045157 isoform X3 [Nilaparvata lugens]